MIYSRCTDAGLDPSQITQPPPNENPIPIDEYPTWSPDGFWIAYSHISVDLGDTTYPTGLYLIDTSGNNRHLLVAGFASNPDWSPDGSWIAFASGAIFKLKPSGENLTKLFSVERAFFPSWSPDGRKIAFDTQYQDPRGAIAIWLVNSDGTGLRDISQHGTGEWREPDWSPDCSRIVHLRYIGIGTEEIFVMDTLGLNPQRLTYNAEVDRDPRWSPDGTKIAWTHVANGVGKIHIMNSDGSSQRELIEGSYPSWSPDSHQIVFTRWAQTKDKATLWISNRDGTGLKQLTR
jgi:Tol biopolymer transport system component